MYMTQHWEEGQGENKGTRGNRGKAGKQVTMHQAKETQRDRMDANNRKSSNELSRLFVRVHNSRPVKGDAGGTPK